MDDLRESPAIEVLRSLVESGSDVVAYEPFKNKFAPEDINFADTLDAAISDSDLILLLAAHSTFRTIDPQKIAPQMRQKNMLDVVNLWEIEPWQAAGFSVYKLGVGHM